MSESRADPLSLWWDAADAFAVGVRRSLDYQRSVADAYQRNFLDRSRRTDDVRTGWDDLRGDVREYGSGVLDLTLDYYRELADVAIRFAEDAIPRVFDSGRATTPYEEERIPHHASLAVHGVVGERVEARFSIENSDDDAAEVFVEPRSCRDEAGDRVDAAVEVLPATMVIEPDRSESVTVAIELDEQLFAAGARYRLPIDVHGPRPAVIDLEIVTGAA